jgi:sodium transport system permease protein
MNAIKVVWLKELRESFRDRRAVLNAVLLAPLIGPVIFVMITTIVLNREFERAAKPLPVPVAGAEHAANLIQGLVEMGLAPLPAPDDPETAVRNQTAEVVLRIPESFEQDWSQGKPAQVEIIYDSSRRDASTQVERLNAMLELYSKRSGAMRLMVRGLSPMLSASVVVARRDQATPQARGALLFAILPYFFVLTGFIGSMSLAIDTTAGERERQSLEPLLINPVPRSHILAGKLGATWVFSILSLSLSIIAFALASRMVPTEKLGMTFELGFGFAATVLVLMLPLLLLVVILQTLVSAFAKTYREAQTLLGLLQLIPVVPSILLTVLPIKPQLWMYAVPLLGQQLAIMQLLRGETVHAAEMSVSLLVTLLAAAFAFLYTARMYRTERLGVSG